MRSFNTTGPCDQETHYMLPAAERLPEAPDLVDEGGYFVVHAPRQTGKTTTLRALARQLTAAGTYAALHVSCEVARSIPSDDIAATQRCILRAVHKEARRELPPALHPPNPWPAYDDSHLFSDALEAWAQSCPQRLVLFLDEIDVLQGNSLLNVLSQLRAAFPNRPQYAPWSVILCGMRDVRDYKAASGGDPNRLGTSSPFNIKLTSLRLGDFSADDVRALYAQHTEATGQPFTDTALRRAHDLTQGQPWLVNATAREIIRNMKIAAPTPITEHHIERAKERLILARATHLDSLAARLAEDRVRRVIQPLLAGGVLGGSSYNDDITYVRDLGLVVRKPNVRIANPIYREVIVRVLAAAVEDTIQTRHRAYILPDGRLDMRSMLQSFSEFWRENGEILTGTMRYHEVAPQLVLMAYLHRIVNGGGFIDREYGIGRHIDLLLRWPYPAESEHPQWQREALEIKVWRDKQPDPLHQGLQQIDEYLRRLDLETGTLVLFDRRERATPLAERIVFEDARTPGGRAITVLRA